MALFQTSVLKKYLKLQDEQVIEKAYKKYVKYFLNPTIQDNIRSSKEEEYQGIFLTELFVNVLAYTLKPNADFNLVAEYKMSCPEIRLQVKIKFKRHFHIPY